MSSSPKKWRTSDGEQQPIKELNIYEYENYYDLIIEMPSIGHLLTAAEFYEFQRRYNEK